MQAPSLPADEAELAPWSVYADWLSEQGRWEGPLLATELSLPATASVAEVTAFQRLARRRFAHDRHSTPIGWCLRHARSLGVLGMYGGESGTKQSLSGLHQLMSSPAASRLERLELHMRATELHARPWQKLAALHRPLLRGLETELGKRVLGQLEAVKAVARRIRLTKLQLDPKPQRPDGVFLFLGPSGVGKTELAKALAQSLYGDLSRLVRIDMSEYAEQHEYAKMIGSPPGYLGYGEEGHLTGPVAKLGHAVILFDEVEKAHQNCHRLMLQLFDEGVLTDGKGKRVDFSQCVVIMTSNIGRDLWADEKNGLGFATAVSPQEPSAKAVLDYLLKSLPSEFVNRVDDLVPFRTFSRADMLPIAAKMMKEEEERWNVRGKKLLFDDSLVSLLVDTGYNARLGARHLQRNLEKLVSQQMSEAACQDDWPEISTVRLQVSGENVTLAFNPPA